MQEIKLLSLFFLFFLLGSCGKETLLPSDYIVWVNNEDNGLVKKKTIVPLEVEALYKPLDYIIANEQRTNAIDKVAYEARKKALEGLQYYTIKLGITGGKLDVTNYEVSDNGQQQERLNYLSFAMQKDIKLVEGMDTLPCVLYHFERSYDIAAYRTFVLAFEKKETNKTTDKTLILDLPYFKTGPVKLNYKIADLEAIPNLKL